MKETIIFHVSITPVLIIPGPKQHFEKEIKKVANAFSCKVNGEVFNPASRQDDVSPNLFGSYSNSFSIVRITAKCTEKRPYKYIIIELNNFSGTGEYLLSDINNDCRYEEFYPDNTYKSTLTKNGKVTIIKDDRINFILSGTFEFIAANTTDSSDITSVSNGHFNLKF